MEELFEKFMREIYCDASCNDYACLDHDVERAAYTAGHFASYCNTLRMMGHEVDDGSYTDNDCNRIAYLKIDGEILMKNSLWQDAFYKIFQ